MKALPGGDASSLADATGKLNPQCDVEARLTRRPRSTADTLTGMRSGRSAIPGFLAFSHGWTWTLWGAAAAVGPTVWAFPAVGLFVLGGAGVLVGGLVMSRVSLGPAGLRDLGVRIVDPWRISPAWWAVALLLHPLLTLAAAALVLASGATVPPLALEGAASRLLNPFGLLAMMGFILVIGPLPEEIGWRGYLLDRLQERWNALGASLILGLVWWSWHLPLFVLPGYFEAFGRVNPTPLDFLYGIVPGAVLYTWVYNNTRRSVLAVIAFHFMENFTGEFLGISPEVRAVRLVLVLVLVLVVIWRWGPQMLSRPRQDRP
jgi:membrane protease YdiL (CAAX protease family)